VAPALIIIKTELLVYQWVAAGRIVEHIPAIGVTDYSVPTKFLEFEINGIAKFLFCL
jgi:hypothetical protein